MWLLFEFCFQTLAPSSPPLNITTEALSPTSIRVTFTPPIAINQNGLVSSYNVTYIGQTFDITTQFVTVNVTNAIYPSTVETLSVNLTGLHEYNNYTVRVSAVNQIGASPFSDGIIQIPSVTPPMLVAYNTSIPNFFFEQDSIQLFCTFSIATYLALTPNISWYRNSTLLTDGVDGFQIEDMSTGDPWLYRSVLSVSSAVPANSGQFYCSATVGNSAANTSSVFSIEVEPAYLPDAVSVQLDRIGYLSAQISWNVTNRVRLTPETYVVSHCLLPPCSSYVSSSVLTLNSFTITELLSVTNYSVFVVTTNRYGATTGFSRNFTTSLLRAFYFFDRSKSNAKTYFASGSVFRGGIGIGGAVTQFYCVPGSPTDPITWYAPNGDIIPEGVTANSFYHTREASGESTLNLNSALTADNDGRNFTCRINSSGFIHYHYFGVYFILDVNTGQFIIGVRLFSKNDPPVVKSFTLQRGIFDFDFNQLYDVESLKLATEPTFGWEFEPNLISPVTPNNGLQVLTNVQFNSSSICQLGYSSFSGDFFSISNKPFVLRTPVAFDYATGPPLQGSSCIEDGSTAYVFTIGEGVDIAVVCPLLYDARFLDISPTNFIQYNYTLNAGGTNPRRLLVDPSQTKAQIVHDRSYVCQDRYGTSSTFIARVDASTPLEVFNSSTAVVPTNNGTRYITNQTTLYCLSDSNLLAVEWYANTNPNRSTEVTYALVSNDTIEQPYVSNPRVGRSDLIISTALPSDRQGYFHCRDSTNRILSYSVFSQQPVSPTAVIIPDTISIDITIGGSTDLLICGYSNSPHPYAISYWAGTSSASIDTSQLLEADTGSYTCVSSNVVDSSTDTISVNVIPPPPQAVNSTQLLTQGDIFETDSFQLSCSFFTFPNVTSPISILWYHNGTLNTVFTNTTNASGDTATSTINITSASVSDTGHYLCVATVGYSLSTNSTPIGVIVIPSYFPDAISLIVGSITFFTVFVSWNGTNRTPPLFEQYSVIYIPDGSFIPIYQSIPQGASTTLVITGLIANTNYNVYISAQNRFGVTLGPTTSFETQRIRLYFVKEGNIVQFSSGSIFRGGIDSDIFDVVTEFHCYPDSSDQLITWYQPNGTVIPLGTASSTGFYHTRDTATGESVFYTNNAVSVDNEGNNFTCSFNQTSGVLNVSSFGIYYVRRDVSTFLVNGIRLFDEYNTIHEFVYQRGVFNLDFNQLYTVECLVPSLADATYWTFIPDLLSQTDIVTTNTTLYQVQFDPNAECQNIRCAPFQQYSVFSNESFLLQTSNTNLAQDINCIPNGRELSFNLGSPLEITITCPLIFGARFVDIGTDITLIENEITENSPRRLWINSTATLATLDQERTYVCEDMYGESVSFSVAINAAGSEPIQIFASENSTVPLANGTNLVGISNIPDTLLCVTQSASNAANWYVDSDPNRNSGQSPALVTTDSSLLPHVVSPRAGRSNLVLNGTIGDAQQGYYSCVTNPSIVLGIFLETPVAPTADISPNQSLIQVVIGTNTPTLYCVTSNIPHPNPIHFWKGSINSSTAVLNSGLLLEADTGLYTCIASNVVDLSTETITITVVPPPPQFISIRIGTSSPIYLGDVFTLECHFITFPNVTSQIIIVWYLNNTQVVGSSIVNVNTAYNGSEATSSLTVSSSQIDRTGDYQCIATVGGSTQSISPILTFSFDPPSKPNFTSITHLTEGTILIGEAFKLSCVFMTLPRFVHDLSIRWYFNNLLVNPSGLIDISASLSGNDSVNSIIAISRASLSQSGVYHCVATVLDSLPSISSSLNLLIYSAPTPQFVSFFLLSETPIYIKDSFSLACRFSITSRFVFSLSINWFQNGTLISILSTSSLTSNVDGNTAISTLSISNAGYERSGFYFCRAGVLGSNFAYSDQIHINIVPVPPPTFSSIGTTTQTVYLNESFHLFCLFSALTHVLPLTTVKWYHNTTEISPCHSRYLINLQHDSVATMNSTLESVSSEECQVGSYHCEAIFEGLTSLSDEYILSFDAGELFV